MVLGDIEKKELEERSRKLRLEIFDLARNHGGYHFGGTLSCVEMLVNLYKKILNNNDRFILSKGHAALAWYPLLMELGYSPKISEHPDMDLKNGICCTTGSLGMGLPTGVGIALARKLKKLPGKIYVLMGEAEFQEGTSWESLLIASHHNLDNLIILIDKNNFQGSGDVNKILSLGNLTKKIEAFDCEVHDVNGHCHNELYDALNKETPGKCKVIIANTTKGKGARCMEKEPGLWHARFPTPEQMKEIYEDLGGKLE